MIKDYQVSDTLSKRKNMPRRALRARLAQTIFHIFLSLKSYVEAKIKDDMGQQSRLV